jgi:hypothetical protein
MFRIAIYIFLFLISLPSSHAENAQTRINIGGTNYGYIDDNSKWTFNDENNKVIFVCWEQTPSQFMHEMGLVKEAVYETWEANSALQFRGWQKCDPINQGIRIQIDDSGPHTKGLGAFLDNKPNGMVLNFEFNNWSPACKASFDLKEQCIKSIAVHEFGHALGFAHEQNRPDAPGECAELRQGQDGTTLLTPYDPKSVMNYCNPVYNNNGMLSKYDIESVQQVYGKK